MAEGCASAGGHRASSQETLGESETPDLGTQAGDGQWGSRCWLALSARGAEANRTRRQLASRSRCGLASSGVVRLVSELAGSSGRAEAQLLPGTVAGHTTGSRRKAGASRAPPGLEELAQKHGSAGKALGSLAHRLVQADWETDTDTNQPSAPEPARRIPRTIRRYR